MLPPPTRNGLGDAERPVGIEPRRPQHARDNEGDGDDRVGPDDDVACGCEGFRVQGLGLKVKMMLPPGVQGLGFR